MLEKLAYELKAAVRRAVTLAGGGTFVAADLGLSAAMLSKVQSAQYEEQLRHSLVPDLEALAGSPVITEWLARQQGYRLVRIDETDRGLSATLADLTRILEQTGDFNTAFSGALADEIIDAHERRELNARIESVCAAFRCVQDKINGAGRS